MFHSENLKQYFFFPMANIFQSTSNQWLAKSNYTPKKNKIQKTNPSHTNTPQILKSLQFAYVTCQNFINMNQRKVMNTKKAHCLHLLDHIIQLNYHPLMNRHVPSLPQTPNAYQCYFIKRLGLLPRKPIELIQLKKILNPKDINGQNTKST